ncbi:ATP-dependent helicase [Paenibacillus sp. CAA11]|uniref:ATP-dependent DNA helicase n=1 Tax=Paenibacillus sp. CAA11 TaxID=1532905 RepID=UPI000D3C4131|nr:ATP-dependent DNA helicase [Paenibacillus sp. CAA11]AWB44541.1 ATP-dependent helicase [Paenibacillus sp. CAA11]
MSSYPFEFNPKEPFIQQASDWIADVLYDILPEAGFEVRDEQIFMAFQLERAYREKSVMFAEAGVGTGKTIAYLLYAVTYARYTRRPAIIACADESLIEQLVKPEGDVAKLAKHLGLIIDARLGKSPDQYICLNKLDEARYASLDGDLYREIHKGLPSFVKSPETLQAFHPYGNRKDYPHLSDEQWGRLGWDAFQDCSVCSQRHRCGQTLSRDYYRKAADLIICSHDFYMEHVWTYETRKRKGQLPLLPEHSSVIFDEGHLLETATQNALTYKLQHHQFESVLLRLLQGEIRESLAMAIEEAISQSESLFEQLDANSRKVVGSDRKELHLSGKLLGEIKQLQEKIGVIEEELVFEGGLFALDEYSLKIVEEHLEMIHHALSLFQLSELPISWLSEDREGLTLVIMPRQVKQVLRERVFSKKMPIVFSSATLSVNGSFDYIAQSLGIEQYESFSVPSPYDYEERMKVQMAAEADPAVKINSVIQLLEQQGGRSLLLFPSKEQLQEFRDRYTKLSFKSSYKLLFEGSAEISHLIASFQQDETSVLCAATLWEGLDIPGPSLSQVIMWELPFPPNDPVFAAKRQESNQPFEEVDLPYMLLRVKQGIGRLIRSREDQGSVTIFGEQLQNPEVRDQVVRLLPEGTLKA